MSANRKQKVHRGASCCVLLDQVTKNGFGWASSPHGGGGGGHVLVFLWEKHRERNYLKNVGVSTRIMLKWPLRKSLGEAWALLLNLAQDRDTLRAVVNAVMIVGFP